ncbi:MAG: Gfo/Idh/MocA family oxidoreductase [Planctomycetes bacterium]|nr:Gfo/Idh/MocA family oxidoreductase [Planctomycetota bacterium]
MGRPISIVLAGLGGYGEVYLAHLLDERDDERFRLVGAVDPQPQRCARLEELRGGGVPVYQSLDDFYRHAQADLAVIASPIHWHCRQTCHALAQGSHVLCEKPAAATVQEVDQMIATRARAKCSVAIGYQWSFSTPIQQLKRDIQAGLFGRPRRFKSLCLWPRGEDYYRRNDWAGRLRAADREWVLDSPVNNAMAHDLHNMLYLLGDERDTSAAPVNVTAELYRANAIENCDTAVLRVHTAAGVEVLFYGSHASAADFGPVFSFEFERAVVDLAGGAAEIVARRGNEVLKCYASPNSEPQMKKLCACCAALADSGEIPCGLEAARVQTLCVNGAHDSAGAAVAFPAALVRVARRAQTRLTSVAGLAETMQRCYELGVLPSEADVPWSRAGRTIDLRHYLHFPGG